MYLTLLKWAAPVVGVALLIGGGYHWANSSAKTKAELLEAQRTTQIAQDNLKVFEKHQGIVNNMREQLDEARNEKDARNDAALKRMHAVLVQLQQRPTRPAEAGASAPARPESCKGATGAELYREDATAIIREAARADRIRAALGECYSALDAVDAAASAASAP